jgi:FtsH-binding integral membrane protein
MNASSKLLYYPKKRRYPFRKNRIKPDGTSNGPIQTAATLTAVERAAFIRKTYFYLAGEIMAFIVIQAVFLSLGIFHNIINTISGWHWSLLLLTLLSFIIVFLLILIIAKDLVNSSASKVTQHIGLGLYVTAQAIILAPLLYLVENKGGLGLILEAGIITVGLFLGLTAVAVLTRKDFSWLLPILLISIFLVTGVTVTGLIFGFSVRSFFSLTMVAIAGGYILYSTSEILHRFQTNQHLQASLTLFRNICSLFWFILRGYARGSRIGDHNHQPVTK